jgi:hypothetical protein
LTPSLVCAAVPGAQFHGGLCSIVVREDGDDRINHFHLILLLEGAAPGNRASAS